MSRGTARWKNVIFLIECSRHHCKFYTFSAESTTLFCSPVTTQIITDYPLLRTISVVCLTKLHWWFSDILNDQNWLFHSPICHYFVGLTSASREFFFFPAAERRESNNLISINKSKWYWLFWWLMATAESKTWSYIFEKILMHSVWIFPFFLHVWKRNVKAWPTSLT